jgi:predicted N-acetyltransferase YhbS
MNSSAVDIRVFADADAEAVSKLVLEVFDQHVAPSFGAEGIDEMHEFVSAQAITERAKEQSTYVAWRSGSIIAMVQMRTVDHVALLFVDNAYMGQGIAKALMAQVEKDCESAGCSEITVNSSLNAQTFYERVGFKATSEPQKSRGFAFVPMAKSLSLTQ